MSNLALSDNERETLVALANAVIPESKKFNVPGAGDPAIVAQIENDAER